MKRYVRERGSADVARRIGEAPVATCRVTEAEISSALARRVRTGQLRAARRDLLLGAMRDDLLRLHVVELAPPVVAATHALLARHPLRALDALHLAAALLLKEHAGEVEFACFDARLNAAAAAEGLPLLFDG